MYSQIENNKRKTFFFIVIFTILIVFLGFIFGSYYGNAQAGIFLAALISIIMTLVGFYQGDTVTLLSSGAKILEKKDDPQLYRLVENLAITAGIPTPKIYLIQDNAANAFATGRNPEHASIAITTGLLKLMNKQELEGVLAHELSHVKNYDIRIMTLVVVLVGIVLLLSDLFLRNFFWNRKENNHENNQATLIFFLVGIALAILSPLFAQLIKLAVSRSREYLADASGALLTRYPEGLANALEKIALQDQPLQKANHATAHLFLANPFDPHVTKKFEHWFSTHPPIELRIQKLRKMGN